MMPASWRGAEVFAHAKRTLMMRMASVGQFMVNDIRRTLQTPYPPASVAGSPPHRRSGKLEGSIRWETTSEPMPRLRVGTNVYRTERGGTPFSGGYGRFLEWGTTKMKARPYLQPALIRTKAMIASLLGLGAGAVGFEMGHYSWGSWGV